jgi:hypothetical protein
VKRIISLILIAAVVFNISAVANATNFSPSNLSRQVKVAEDGDNLIVVIGGTDALSQKTYDISTEYDGIVMSSDGCYALALDFDDETITVPVGKLDIDVTDEEAFAEAMVRDDISDYAKADIENLRIRMAEIGDEDYSVSIFSDKLLDTVSRNETRTEIRYLPAPSAQERAIFAAVDNGTMSTQSISYLPWPNGPVSVMGVEQLTTNNIDMALITIAENSNVANYVNGTGNINISIYQSVTGFYSQVVVGAFVLNAIILALGASQAIGLSTSLADSGYNLLQTIQNGKGIIYSVGSGSEFFEAAPHYNKTYRYIFGPNNTLGLKAISINVTRWDTRYKFGSHDAANYAVHVVSETFNDSGYTIPSNGFNIAYSRVINGDPALVQDAVWKTGTLSWVLL